MPPSKVLRHSKKIGVADIRAWLHFVAKMGALSSENLSSIVAQFRGKYRHLLGLGAPHISILLRFRYDFVANLVVLDILDVFLMALQVDCPAHGVGDWGKGGGVA